MNPRGGKALMWAAIAAGGAAVGFQLSPLLERHGNDHDAGLITTAPPQPSGPLPTGPLPAAPVSYVGPGPSFVDLARDVGPAVVNLQVSKGVRGHWGEKTYVEGQGSGFLISEDGEILTNEHVVGDARRITVTMLDDRQYEGRVIGSDPETDLALVKIDVADPLPFVRLGDSDALAIGEWVIAIGNPFGLDHTVTAGIVSAKGRRNLTPSGRRGLEDYVQTDAAINPGNSGGPLLNLRGEVVAINAATSGQGQGISFAIPVNMARSFLPQLRAGGRVARSYLGVMIDDVTAEAARARGLARTAGAFVAQVQPGSPAEGAGIGAGDIVVAFDGKPVARASDLRLMTAAAGIGREVVVEVVTGRGQKRTVKVELAQRPTH